MPTLSANDTGSRPITKIRPIRELAPEVARKIAAGEVIDRPAAVVRELLDNAIDSGASRVSLEIAGGGIDSIRVIDNGSGMTAEDLAICAKTHTTSKISVEDDLLSLSTLGFRGEALSSIQAVSRLEITTTRDGRAAWKLDSGTVTPARLSVGTIVQVSALFANFPARRQFLKRPAAETALCRQTFTEKALAWPWIEFRYTVDGVQKTILPPAETLRERCLAALEPKESESFFYEIAGSGTGFSFTTVLGNPDVTRSDRRDLMVFVNGRRIMEYGLLQAMEYGAEGHFPNGAHPVGCLFVTIDPALVDFNIHPAKREARFRDPASLHHAVSSAVRDFYRRWTIASLARAASPEDSRERELPLYTGDSDAPGAAGGNEPSDGESNDGNQTPRDSSVWEPRVSGYSGSAGYTKGVSSRAASGTDFSAPLRDRPVSMGPARSYPESDRSPAIEAYEAAHTDDPRTVSFRYLGQVLGTFLAVERGGVFYLIDQHAAHERILFDEIRARRGRAQELLVPYRIETDSTEADGMLAARKEALTQAGFTIEDEGSGLWQVTAVPAAWVGTQKDLEEDILDPAVNPETLADHLWATAACRAACKDGDVLDSETARGIAERAFALPEPVCPHGRPVWVTLTREELFARIKRT